MFFGNEVRMLLMLPDTYSGLGFQESHIHVVVEDTQDFHARWIADKEQRAPLHLIFIEEPEAHLHAQLQQVFIRNVLELVKTGARWKMDTPSKVRWSSRPTRLHILYERGFQPIRYFKRLYIGGEQKTDVLNLSAFYNLNPTDREFLQKYL